MIAADRTAPRGTIRLGSRNLAKIVKSGRVPLRVTCDEACSAVVSVRVTRKLAKGSVTAGARKTLSGRLAAGARRAMRRRNSLKLSLAATFTDSAGNTAERIRKGTLKRPTRRR